jgi:hypothetical protein
LKKIFNIDLKNFILLKIKEPVIAVETLWKQINDLYNEEEIFYH